MAAITTALRIKLKGEEIGVWDLDTLDIKESMALGAATGLDPIVICQGLGTLNPSCWQAVVWHLRRKNEPNLDIADVNFAWGDLDADPVEAPKVPPTRRKSKAVPSEASAASETSGSTPSPAG